MRGGARPARGPNGESDKGPRSRYNRIRGILPEWRRRQLSGHLLAGWRRGSHGLCRDLLRRATEERTAGACTAERATGCRETQVWRLGKLRALRQSRFSVEECRVKTWGL